MSFPRARIEPAFAANTWADLEVHSGLQPWHLDNSLSLFKVLSSEQKSSELRAPTGGVLGIQVPVWPADVPGRLPGNAPQFPSKPLPRMQAPWDLCFLCLHWLWLPGGAGGPGLGCLGQHNCSDKLLPTCPLSELQRPHRSASTPGHSAFPRAWR